MATRMFATSDHQWRAHILNEGRAPSSSRSRPPINTHHHRLIGSKFQTGNLSITLQKWSCKVWSCLRQRFKIDFLIWGVQGPWLETHNTTWGLHCARWSVLSRGSPVHLVTPVGAGRNCFNLWYFTQEERGIGYSFQLAITAPLYSITGYCIATAQS